MASDNAVIVLVEKQMRLLRVEALEKGELTDVSFLVGPVSKAELVHCVKRDLIVGSEYFRALFRSPLTGPPPVRMKHIQPHIFKIILRYISTNTVETVSCVQDAVDLAHAADEFLLDGLKLFYLAEITKMVNIENVWKILSRSKLYEVMSLCNKVLSTKTRECLGHHTLFESTMESFVYFLQLNEMTIKSEHELIDACLNLAHKMTAKERHLFMKAALPHLRLLTLKLDEIQREVLEYLSDTEKAYLLTKSREPLPRIQDKAVGNLCPNIYSRKFSSSCPMPKVTGKQILNIIPESMILTSYAKMFSAKLKASACCYLACTPAHNILLNAIDILTPAKEDPILSIRRGSNELLMETVNFSATVKVHYSNSNRILYQQSLGFTSCFNAWCKWKFDKEVVIPRGVRFWITVTYNRKYNFIYLPENESQKMATEAAQHRAVLNVDLEDDFGNINLNVCTCFMIKSVYFEVI